MSIREVSITGMTGTWGTEHLYYSCHETMNPKKAPSFKDHAMIHLHGQLDWIWSHHGNMVLLLRVAMCAFSERVYYREKSHPDCR